MGQLVAVTEKPSTTPGVVRFEVNRTLSGQGHERFGSPDDAYGATSSDELARRLFATGQVAGLHVYSNIITVDLQKGFGSEGLAEVVRDLYQYWAPGVEPPSFEDLQPEELVEGVVTHRRAVRVGHRPDDHHQPRPHPRDQQREHRPGGPLAQVGDHLRGEQGGLFVQLRGKMVLVSAVGDLCGATADTREYLLRHRARGVRPAHSGCWHFTAWPGLW